MKDKKHKGTANPEYAKAMFELRRSGASGTHADKRDKRARTRSAQLQRALNDERNEGHGNQDNAV